MTRVARIVTDAREGKGWSLRAVAEQSGFARDTWNNVELSRPARMGTYYKIERALGLPAGSLAKARRGEWIAGDRPVSGAEARLATMIRAVETDTEVPQADVVAITAVMSATLAHLRAERVAG